MVDLVAVRSLIAVRDCGSVVAAAAALGYTPSAVSQQIKRLERSSGTAMLEKVGRSVILSQRARLLAARGERVLGDIEAMEQLAVGEAEALGGSLRIATFSTACRGLIAPALALLKVSAPQLTITVIELDPREAIAAVEQGNADMSLVHDWAMIPLEIPDQLMRRHLMIDDADVIVRHDHRLAGATRALALEFADEHWVTTHAGSICQEWLIQMFAVHGVRPDMRYFDSTYASHFAMVSAGVAVALVPRLGRETLPPQLRAVAVSNPTPQRQVSAIWRKSMDENPAIGHVLDQVESVICDGHPQDATYLAGRT